MIRSGKTVLPAIWVGALIGATALNAASERRFALAAVLAGAWVIGLALVLLLVHRASPENLKERSRAHQRHLAVLGRAMGKASGGWDPRHQQREPLRRERHSPRSDERARELGDDR